VSKPAKKKAGRPRENREVMKSRTFRCTDAEWEKALRLGGGSFLRLKIQMERLP